MKRKRLLNRLGANDPDYAPEKSNLKHPPKMIATTNFKSNYGIYADDPNYVPEECHLKYPPKTIAITNLKLNDGSFDKVMNVMDSLHFWGNEVNQDQIPCFAFAPVNYSPKIKGIGMFMNSLSVSFSVIVIC